MARRYLHAFKYHLSPISCYTSIKARGLVLPKPACEGGRIWLCDWQNIPNVAYHLLDVRKQSYIHFIIFSVRWWNVEIPLRKHGRDGIYWIPSDIPRNLVEPEGRFIADKWSPDSREDVG